MRCDVCGSSDSIFFIKPDGRGGELRMCRSCAVTRGYASEDEVLGPASGTCASCGWTAALIRSSGRLGCPDCVQAFRREIMSALKRSGSHGPYDGKVPRRNSGAPDEPSPASLSKALEQAIKSEKFEEAADLRDKIRASSKGSAS